jgi:hypothetical protein
LKDKLVIKSIFKTCLHETDPEAHINIGGFGLLPQSFVWSAIPGGAWLQFCR